MRAIEGLFLASETADDDGESEAKQAVPDNGASQLGLDDVALAGGEDEQREDELGGIAKRDIQQSPDSGTGATREMRGGAADPLGERNHRQYGEQERQHRLRRRQVSARSRSRNEQQEPDKDVGHAISARSILVAWWSLRAFRGWM